MGPNPADPIALISQVLTVLLGVALANLIAPHIVVILAGAIGGVFGLMAWRQCTRPEALWYVAMAAGGAWLFAGAASALVQHYVPVDNPSSLLAPVAAIIAWVGHRWPAVLTWGLRRWMQRAPTDRGPQP